MADINISTTGIGTALTSILLSDDMEPGAPLSYQLAKTLYTWHPLGSKMVDKPIEVAMSQKRDISIPNAPDRVVEEFNREWKKLGANKLIRNTMSLSRIYGVATLVYGAKGFAPNRPIPPDKFAGLDMFFNVADPLNTAGSLVLNQDPNSPDFLKPKGVAIAGVPYHPSRACVMLNEEPIYIEYTTSAFGYVGRSVFQRPLYSLKSFILLMIADSKIAEKLALLIAKQKQPGSIVDRIMMGFAGLKRSMLKGGKSGNVLSIDIDEEIETLNMMNVDGAGKYARNNVLSDIAAAASMPAMMINDETFAEGFGEGTEDAKAVAQFIDGLREQMDPIYDFLTRIVQYRAWSEEFYATIQADFPDQYGGVPYQTAFFKWVNDFTAAWPSLLIEPESERSKAEKVILDALVEVGGVLMPALDPENKAELVKWMADNLNDKKLLFTSPLNLDYVALAEYVPPVMDMGDGDGEDGPSKPNPKK